MARLLPSGNCSCHCRPGGPARACQTWSPCARTLDGVRLPGDSPWCGCDAPGPGELAGGDRSWPSWRGRRAGALAGDGARALVDPAAGDRQDRWPRKSALRGCWHGHRLLRARGVEDGRACCSCGRGAGSGRRRRGRTPGASQPQTRLPTVPARTTSRPARYRPAAAAADAITAAADEDGLLGARRATCMVLTRPRCSCSVSLLWSYPNRGCSCWPRAGRPRTARRAPRSARPGPAAWVAHAAAGGAGRGGAGRNPAGRRSDRDPGAGPGRARPRPRVPAPR